MQSENMGTKFPELFAALAAPFAFEDVEVMCRNVVTSSAKGTVGMPIIYMDARAVANRLCDVVGFENWTASYQFIPYKSPDGKEATGVLCNLIVKLPDGTNVMKQDGADITDIESFKGGVSDSLKRAFAALANRTLYEFKPGWKPCDTYEKGGKTYFKKWTEEGLAKLEKEYNAFFFPPKPAQPESKPEPKPAPQPAKPQPAPKAEPAKPEPKPEPKAEEPKPEPKKPEPKAPKPVPTEPAPIEPGPATEPVQTEPASDPVVPEEPKPEPEPEPESEPELAGEPTAAPAIAAVPVTADVETEVKRWLVNNAYTKDQWVAYKAKVAEVHGDLNPVSLAAAVMKQGGKPQDLMGYAEDPFCLD